MPQSTTPTPDAAEAARIARRDRFHYLFVDHAILRYLWHNFHEVAPGVYRSNHPNHARFAKYKAMGIKTILNLRGEPKAPHHRYEKASCKELGLTLVSTSMWARKAAPRAALLTLLDHFKTIEKPFVMHCKSGADRAGIASAFYLLAEEGADIATARRMLSFRYLHIKASATGVLDHILDMFEARQAQGAIGLRDWIANEYDPEVVTQSWMAKRGKS